jgi:transketolase
MRNAFADELTRVAHEDPRIVLLSGDIGNRLFDNLREQYPERFFNCGVAEQNMMGVAAGMGLCGLRPIVYTITPFTTMRCLEQIKIGVAYHQSPVVIVGTGSGLSYASLGPTHHSLEDFAIFRAIPNLQVLAPWDAKSLRVCLRMAIDSNRPTYIRIGKKGEPNLTMEQTVPPIGGGLTLCSGQALCIIAVGTIANEAVIATKILQKSGVSVELVFVHTVKPMPEEFLSALLNRFDCFVTVEEHAKAGGFGESFLSFLAQQSMKKKIVTLGTGDNFMSTVGSQSYARGIFQIDAAAITQAAKSLVMDSDL